MAKILARFQPMRRDSTLGYWIQRSDDSYVMFALASYVLKKFGFYPYLPICFDQTRDMPLAPPGQSRDRLKEDNMVSYTTDDEGGSHFIGLTSSDQGACSTADDNVSNNLNTDVEIGAPNPNSAYPDSYWAQRDQWIEEIMNYTAQVDSKACMLRIMEHRTEESNESNLHASVAIYDSSDSLVYSNLDEAGSRGTPINDASPWHLKEGNMKEELVIVGQHVNDYIQFSYGDQWWQSSTTEGTPNCTMIGDDWTTQIAVSSTLR